MSQPITIEDIYKLFQASQAEADRRAAENDRRAAEADRRAAENDRRAAEADRRAAEFDRCIDRMRDENDRRAAENEKTFAELNRKADRLFQLEADGRAAAIENDRIRAEAEAQYRAVQAELDRRREKSMEELRRAMANLTTRWGRFVEELVEPAASQIFQERGIDIKEVHPRAHVKRQGVAMEIDVLAVADTAVVLIECKSRLTQEDIDYFLTKLQRFKEAFPLYSHHQIYGAVAGIEINEGIDRYAYHKGLFVIRPSGEVVEIVNDQNFVPATW